MKWTKPAKVAEAKWRTPRKPRYIPMQMPLMWTRRIPTKSRLGFYWVRSINGLFDPTVVEVKIDELDGSLSVFQGYELQGDFIENWKDREWAGPIPQPKEKM